MTKEKSANVNDALEHLRAGKARYRQGIAEVEALKKGMEEKSKEFAEKGSEIYAKA